MYQNRKYTMKTCWSPHFRVQRQKHSYASNLIKRLARERDHVINGIRWFQAGKDVFSTIFHLFMEIFMECIAKWITADLLDFCERWYIYIQIAMHNIIWHEQHTSSIYTKNVRYNFELELIKINRMNCLWQSSWNKKKTMSFCC